jgi:hypothetical protein
MLIRPTIAAFVLLLAAPLAHAAEAVVHGVQAPAWVQRGERVVVAKPGQQLRAGDVLRTGAGGRMELSMSGDSRLQVGEFANIGLGVGIDVVKGAFRYSTGPSGSGDAVQIRVGVGSIVLSQADVWGIVAQDSRSMLVLLEGGLTLQHAEQQLSVDTTRAAILMQATERREQIATAEQLVALLAQTDPRADSAMMVDAGAWAIVLTSVRDLEAAQAMVLQLAQSGYAGAVRTVELDSGTYHRVVVEDLRDSGQAQMMADEIEERLGFADAWIMRP